MADVFIQLFVPPQTDAVMADQHLVDGFHRRAEVAHPGIKLECQRIQGRHLVDVGGGSDHRVGAEHPGQIAAEGIRAPAWPESRLMTCWPRSSITTTAGSLNLSLTSGASTRTAIPVAPMKISAE